MKKATLVVMAAGMASRYGGNKQIEGMGPNGEILLEYSIHDAVRAGFSKVVLIIKPEMRETMNRLMAVRSAGRVEIEYAYQDFASLPAFYTVPENRVKPFGTVHAALCARPFVHEPFAIINADDYYGVEPFQQMYEFLTGGCAPGHAAMMGYRLKNTVSRHGTVTRGLCRMENGLLTGVREVKGICQCDDGSIVEASAPDRMEPLDPEALVSMNFWGFPAEIFEPMQEYFEEFLRRSAPDDLLGECLLPVMVDRMIREGALDVRVLDTPAAWFGVTYKEDRPNVVRALKKLHEQGVY